MNFNMQFDDWVFLISIGVVAALAIALLWHIAVYLREIRNKLKEAKDK